MTDEARQFRVTTEAIQDVTETMLRWGLPAEVILKAVEHLKGVRRAREIEMECKAAEIQAEVRKQAAEHVNAFQRAANAMSKPEPKS